MITVTVRAEEDTSADYPKVADFPADAETGACVVKDGEVYRLVGRGTEESPHQWTLVTSGYEIVATGPGVSKRWRGYLTPERALADLPRVVKQVQNRYGGEVEVAP